MLSPIPTLELYPPRIRLYYWDDAKSGAVVCRFHGCQHALHLDGPLDNAIQPAAMAALVRKQIIQHVALDEPTHKWMATGNHRVDVWYFHWTLKMWMLWRRKQELSLPHDATALRPCETESFRLCVRKKIKESEVRAYLEDVKAKRQALEVTACRVTRANAAARASTTEEKASTRSTTTSGRPAARVTSRIAQPTAATHAAQRSSALGKRPRQRVAEDEEDDEDESESSDEDAPSTGSEEEHSVVRSAHVQRVATAAASSPSEGTTTQSSESEEAIGTEADGCSAARMPPPVPAAVDWSESTLKRLVESMEPSPVKQILAMIANALREQ